MWTVLLNIAIVFLLLFLTYMVWRWRNPMCSGKLPPGSMGLPIIGETLQFFAPHTTRGIPPFIKKRIDKYGSVFRTSLVGHPVVISTDSELNRFIFQQEGKLFKSWYTTSFDDIAGQDNVLSVHGPLHKYLRNLVLNFLGNESLKQRLLYEVEELTCEHLQLWSRQISVDLKEAFSDMIYNFSVRKVFSMSDSRSIEKLRKCYAAFLYGLISFPLSIPGTAYRKCLQGRKEALKIVKRILDERRAMPVRREKDFLDLLIEEIQKEGSLLTEETALNLLFALPFAAFESASSALTLAVQYLGEHPLALAELTKENDAILRERQKVEPGITWKEYKSMNFTHMVINETLRLANIVPTIFRKVVKDVEIKGYTIPAGWIVMVCPAAVHLNPALYDDPLNFNPWRWQLPLKQGRELHAGSKTFLAFGGGMRLCVGAEFVKLQMAIFLHHLVTKYRWTVIRGEDPVRHPGVVFPNGFHVQIAEKDVLQLHAK